MSLADAVVGRGESERKAPTATANQLIPTSPVAKKCNVISKLVLESTERVIDLANRTGVIGFLPTLNTEA